jgi:hypothetical protein
VRAPKTTGRAPKTAVVAAKAGVGLKRKITEKTISGKMKKT